MRPVRWFALAAALSAPAVLSAPGPAAATPATDATVQTLSESTVDGVDYVVRQITIAPGGSTGWHYHDGEVFGVIEQGTLTRTLADCQVDGVFPAGSPVAEGSGPEHVHIGRNLEQVPLVMRVVYIQPTGIPLATEVPAPACGFG